MFFEQKVYFFIFFIISLILLSFFLYTIYILNKKKEKREVEESLQSSLFLVKLPKAGFEKDGKLEQNKKVFIQAMEQFYLNFLRLNKDSSGFLKNRKKNSTISFEISSRSNVNGIFFYISVPNFIEKALEKYITGIFPTITIKKIPKDYTIFEENKHIAGGYFKLKKSDFISLTTYNELEKNPLFQIINSLSKIKTSEGASIQITIKPFSGSAFQFKANKIIEKMEKGDSLRAATEEVNSTGILKQLVAFFYLLIIGTKDNKNKNNKIVDRKTIEGIQKKIKKEVFEVNIRIVSSAESKNRANEIIKHIESSFNQFSLTSYNSLIFIDFYDKKLKKLVYNYIFRVFNPLGKIILNTEELASLFHFPAGDIDIPGLNQEKALSASPPENLSKTGVLLLGKIFFREEKKKVYYSSNTDRRRHLYIIGQTGTGKSSFMMSLIKQDIQNNKGVCVIDPHGDLVLETLAIIPEERIEDVVLFEPFNTEKPMGLNMLDAKTQEDKDFAVQEMISIFFKLFDAETMGPMFEHYMRHAMLTLMSNNESPGTLVEISRIFTDDEYVKKYLKNIEDPFLLHFWNNEWFKMPENTRSDMSGYLVSKLGRFVENKMMRNIIGQSQSGINFEEIMDKEKILLVNLSKGLTGEVNSSLLGLILVSKIQMTAMKRAKILERDRKDFYLYIDEFQNFTTDSISSILSEARKYKLNLILAHQYVSQLTDEIRDAVIGNVGSMASFRIGVNDAEILEKQFSPEFSKFDLINIDNYKAISKIMINNKISSSFVLDTIAPDPLPLNSNEIIKKIREASELKYTKSMISVEKEIMKRMNIN